MGELFDRIRHVLGIDLEERDLAGGLVSGDVPLTTALVNRLLAQRLAASRGRVAAVRVDAQENDRFTVELSLRGPRIIPIVRIAAQIDQQPALPHSPIVAIRWSLAGVGRLARFAGPVLAFFKALPPGVSVDDDRLRVDVRVLLRAYGLGDLLRYLSSLEFHTRRDAFMLRFVLRVPTEDR